jgi:hypothetical protein
VDLGLDGIGDVLRVVEGGLDVVRCEYSEEESEGSGVDDRETGLEELVVLDLGFCLRDISGEVAGEEEEIKLLGADEGRDGIASGDDVRGILSEEGVKVSTNEDALISGGVKDLLGEAARAKDLDLSSSSSNTSSRAFSAARRAFSALTRPYICFACKEVKTKMSKRKKQK